MKKIRIGNDIRITWTITRNGQAEPLTGRDISVYLVRKLDNVRYPFTYALHDNVVVGDFYGKDQEATGEYYIVLTENAGKVDMHTIDHAEAFRIVESSSKADSTAEDCSNITVEVVELADDLAYAKDGLSAYEIAVLHGYEGTEEEWINWLEGGSEKADEALEQIQELSENVANNYATKTEVTRGLATKQNTLTAGTGIAIENDVISSTVDANPFVIASELPYSYAPQNFYREPSSVTQPAGINANGEVVPGHPSCVVCTYDISGRNVLNGINVALGSHGEIDTHTWLLIAFYDSIGGNHFISGIEFSGQSSVSTLPFPNFVIVPEGAGCVKIVWHYASPQIQCGLATPSGQPNKIYIIPSETQGEDNHYTEYVIVNGKYEKFGEFHADVDLSSYYQKPASGIPYSDLASSIQASLDKADTALQSEKVFAAIYGSTTFNDVSSAVNAGKAVGCLYNGNIAWLTSHDASNMYFNMVQSGVAYTITLQRMYSRWSIVSQSLQPKLTAGTGINIDSNNVISATDDKFYLVDLSVNDLLANPLASTTIAKLSAMRLDPESPGKLILFHAANDSGNTLVPATITKYGSNFEMYLYYDGRNIHVTADSTNTTWEVTQTTLYVKPSGGIPSTDLSNAVQTSLVKADAILQTDLTVNELLASPLTQETTTKLITLRQSGNIRNTSLLLINDGVSNVSATVTSNGSEFSLYFYHNGENVVVTGDYLNQYSVTRTPFYSKPNTGIPSTDLSTAVQASLGKADTALQEESVFVATYGTTTAAEIQSAISAGKNVMCDKDNTLFLLTRINSENYQFGRIDGNEMSTTLTLTIANDTWSSNNRYFERTSNKVTTLSSSSTDTQYPSAACVWGLIGDVESLLAAI